MKTRNKRILSILLVLTTLIGSSALGGMAVSAAEIGPTQSVVNGRCDGNWLWPLAVPFAAKQFSDWAGCRAGNTCPFHGKDCPNNPSCDPQHSTAFGHNGVDIGNGDVQYGTEVLAANPGYAYYKDSTSGDRGRTVVIEHPIDDNSSYYSYYQHLSKVCLTEQGNYVQAGDVIGKVGGSGKGSETHYGKHLHFSIVIGERGLGEKYKNNVAGLIDTEITNIEQKGWLTKNEYYEGEGENRKLKEGRVVTNPDVANVNEIGGSKNAAYASHCGSVHYVDKDDTRTLNFSGKSRDRKTDYTFKVEGTTITMTLTNKNINKKATWKKRDDDGDWTIHYWAASYNGFSYAGDAHSSYCNGWELGITIPEGSREIPVTDTKAYNTEIHGYNYLYGDNSKFTCTSATVSGNTLTVVIKTDEASAMQLRYRLSGANDRCYFGDFAEELLTGKRNNGSGSDDPGSPGQNNGGVIQKITSKVKEVANKVISLAKRAVSIVKKVFWFLK